jgi:NADH-quinone oxidoreductase subunit C
MNDRSLLPALAAVAATLENEFGERLLEKNDFRGELTYRVAPDDWKTVLAFCRDCPELDFDQLDCLIGDHLPERTEAPFEVLAHLVSHARSLRLRIKTALADGALLSSVTELWSSAGFDEREAHEMYGIYFVGHPNLSRLLTADDFQGYPLRKDFPLQGTVGGRIRTDLRGKI